MSNLIIRKLSIYNYNTDAIKTFVPDSCGVYFLHSLNSNGRYTPHYVGMCGGGRLKQRLLEHINNKEWEDISHFGFITCNSENEASIYESANIAHFNPKYNKRGKIFDDLYKILGNV